MFIDLYLQDHTDPQQVTLKAESTSLFHFNETDSGELNVNHLYFPSYLLKTWITPATDKDASSAQLHFFAETGDGIMHAVVCFPTLIEAVGSLMGVLSRQYDWLRRYELDFADFIEGELDNAAVLMRFLTVSPTTLATDNASFLLREWHAGRIRDTGIQSNPD